MTEPTWKRDVPGPAMHALVIGVAGYPAAKPGLGHDATLREVEDVACAVASARRMADWLFDNKDTLTPPLASIDLLLSEAPADPDRLPYPMKLQPQVPIEEATSTIVGVHGDAWQNRFKDGDSAFLFISGHGAMKGNDAVVFLSDLNSQRTNAWGTFLNISETARALKSDQRLKAAYLFSDACQEYNETFARSDRGVGTRFYDAQDPIKLAANAREKVAFITAASQGLETLEGDWETDSKVKMGRFTQLLVESLDGASARNENGKWIVYAESIAADLKNLYRLRSWTDPFEPSPMYVQNERFSIICHQQPEVPVVVRTQPPERLPRCTLEIFLPPDLIKPIKQCAPAERKLWEVWLAASIFPHIVVATDANTKSPQVYFTPMKPIFGQTVSFI